MKLTPKQKEIVRFMRDGHPMMIGQSDTTGRPYYMIAGTHNNGYGNTYFTARVFGNLLEKQIIYFDNSEHDYLLTKLGETIDL